MIINFQDFDNHCKMFDPGAVYLCSIWPTAPEDVFTGPFRFRLRFPF